MEPRVATPVQWVRALFAGSFAFFLGVAGHLMADGLLPGTAFLVVVYAFTLMLSVPVLARPASVTRAVGLLVGGQTVIHLCLTLTAGHVGDPRPGGAAPMVHDAGFTQLPTVDGRRVGSLQDAFAGTNTMPRTTPTLPVHHVVADLSAHAPMMAAHLAAAALVGVWLAYGERLALALLSCTGRAVLAVVHLAHPVEVEVRAFRRSLTDVAVDGFRDLLHSRALSRRGPPLLAA